MSRVRLEHNWADKVIERPATGGEVWAVATLEFECSDPSSATTIGLEYDTPPFVLVRKLLTSLFPLVTEQPFTFSGHSSIIVDNTERDVYDASRSVLLRASAETVTAAVVDGNDLPVEHKGADLPWDSITFQATVTVSAQNYIETVLNAAEESVAIADDASAGRQLENRGLLDLLELGREIRADVVDAGTVTGYEPDLSSSVVQQYLYDADYLEPRLSKLLIDRGVIHDEVAHLRGESDDETVSKKYQSLLSHDSEAIQQAVARELLDEPDSRAKEWLLGRRWAEDPDVTPTALRAAAKLGGEDVRDALCETLEFSSHVEIRLAAVEALANFEGEAVIETLETAVSDDESERVRRAAESSLKAVRS